ncbi:beta-galactosidase trimerization domain-containing protein [Streptomyces sp. Je 1-369]|uniref:beta-galactosidase trimerization domain-containing protein n=1 Tax=Streptomyces sp. Je 1-369 TaxID=2966192 RepID=UPI002285B22E|nr:beta-galactosidase trimerization domain-containing protein [Streptomyces sp. Je 1-369]WAL93713.1 beta-galactosidase trimerization domain-containing protein [Streptomyces sp. Je 1-369]
MAGDIVNGGRVTFTDGALHRDGHPFVSVGVNYHPSPTGCDYWREWDGDRIDDDFRRMAAEGLNTVRFFVFWADFEPKEGVYDSATTDRLRDLVRTAGRHGLLCLPSLLTIWMNGQRFDLPWRDGRDLWRDADLRERQRAFVHHIAAELRDEPNILAYDLGDEVIHVDSRSSAALGPEEVRAWWGMLASAIRDADPDALVLQANEPSAVLGGHAFRPEHAESLDMVGLHGFPVWTPFHIESVAARKATAFLPYLVRRGSAHRPVYVDELGSYGCDDTTAAQYLRAATHSAFAAGAVGTAVWCWQDFTTERKPYALRPNERRVGLLDADGGEKPALAEYQAFARRVSGELAGFRPLPAPVGVFVPDSDEQEEAGYLTPSGSDAPAAFYAHLLLQQAHLPYEFTGRDTELARHALVIVPSARRLSLPDRRRLARYVTSGGVLLYSTGSLLDAAGDEELFGVRVRDFTRADDTHAEFTWAGVRFPLHWDAEPIPVIDTAGAETLAAFADGSPALTRHRLGDGSVHYLNAPLEAQLNAPYRLREADWHRLYEAVAEDAGVRAPLTADNPSVETTVLGRGDERCGVVINHAPEPVDTVLRRPAADGTPESEKLLRLEPKGVRLLFWHGDDPALSEGRQP